MKRPVASVALLGCAALASCGDEASVVFGVTSEIKPSLIERIEARVVVAGEERVTKTYFSRITPLSS